MTRRARHLLLAWITYGVLQLGLLGVPAAAGQAIVGIRDACSQTGVQSLTATKRLLASERSDRTAPTPFAPSATIVIGLPNVVEPSQIVALPDWATPFELALLPPARAPPVRL